MNIPAPREDTAIILAKRINESAKSLDLVKSANYNSERHPDFINQVKHGRTRDINSSEGDIINTVQSPAIQERVKKTDDILSVGEDLTILLSEESALDQYEEILSLGPQKKDTAVLEDSFGHRGFEAIKGNKILGNFRILRSILSGC